MRLKWIGSDPNSRNGNSPALYKTDRVDRETWGVQGWIIDDPEAQADVRRCASNETVVEVPTEVLELYRRQRSPLRRLAHRIRGGQFRGGQ